ncbi:CARDB domain-containing protein [Bifidobacterium sp. CP2]|uniref:CARDB domain-containing protein n=1 Tax=Bifidobacterium sp. CP2 TaxID=2809025 RepID=UPI001F0AE3CD|nr:CARDB domain-containing protein [Bifidobacterium sp. CP2]
MTTLRTRIAAMTAAMIAALSIVLAPAIAPAPTTTHHAGGIASIAASIAEPVRTAYADDAASDNASAGATGEDVAPISGPVPNVIITNFTYGDGSVPVGGDFTLTFTFQNKGKVAVSNMVVTVDGGDAFAIAGGANTFYVDALYAGRSATQSVPMQALSSATSGAQGVTVGFRYEYVDGGSRSSSSSDIKISVPVSQPDRFQLDDPVPPEDATVGTETTITMNYVNKGKGDIANVEASIEGEGLETTTKTQYVGNVASGASGSIGFAFTPTASGSIEAKLHIVYEDSDGKPQSKEFPVTVDVAEAPAVDETDMTVEDATADAGVPWWVWAVAAIVVGIAVVVTVVVVRRRRKRKEAAQAEADDWDDWGKTPASDADTSDASEASASVSSDPLSPSVPSAASDAQPTQVLDLTSLPAPDPSSAVAPVSEAPSASTDGHGPMDSRPRRARKERA